LQEHWTAESATAQAKHWLPEGIEAEFASISGAGDPFKRWRQDGRTIEVSEVRATGGSHSSFERLRVKATSASGRRSESELNSTGHPERTRVEEATERVLKALARAEGVGEG
jgi:hypothetical protein